VGDVTGVLRGAVAPQPALLVDGYTLHLAKSCVALGVEVAEGGGEVVVFDAHPTSTATASAIEPPVGLNVNALTLETVKAAARHANLWLAGGAGAPTSRCYRAAAVGRMRCEATRTSDSDVSSQSTHDYQVCLNFQLELL
jgi:hypothetical protein